MPSKDVFIPKKDVKKTGLTVGVLLNKKDVKGEVGIEIEVEGKKLPHEDATPSPWMYHVDNSLRGEDNGEYVLAKPIAFDKVPAALKALWKAFDEKKSKLDDSNRTSVHIHLNCQGFYLNRLTSFIALYFIVEEILTEWCGEFRVGNLFCLRAKDASAIATYFKNFIMHDGQAPIQEFLHYAAMNANALKKFGSIEFRTLRGTSDPGVIADWVEILERLYKLSEEYDDPRDVCAKLSSMGPLAFFDDILGPKASVVRRGIAMTDNDICESIYEGVRIAQDICYCRDWDLFNPVKLKPDPFSRSLKNVAKKMTGGFGQYNQNADADLVQELDTPDTGFLQQYINSHSASNNALPTAAPSWLHVEEQDFEE